LAETITDEDVMEAMKGMLEIKTLQAEDIASGILYALQQPDHVDVAEVMIMPTQQG
jgi:NADP-dependent 3-hydroxy acid dehydrogenase YdfG